MVFSNQQMFYWSVFLASYGRNCSQTCVNTPGSFYCDCHEGFYLDVNGILCIAEATCAKNLCEQSCERQKGVDTCTCGSGYVLNTDNVTCLDIGECYTYISTYMWCHSSALIFI